MKKHYFLALMASIVCGMSVQAQVSVQPVKPQNNRLQVEKAGIPTLVQEPGSQLRSGLTYQLDSVVRTNNRGAIDCIFLYEHTDEGFISLLTGYMWDATTSDWADEKFYSYAYTYDERGNRIRTECEAINDGQVSTEITTNSYDDQNRLVSTHFVSDERHIGESYTYQEDGTCNYMCLDSLFSAGVYTDTTYLYGQKRTLDEAGNVTKSVYLSFYGEWIGEETEVYQYAEENFTYDSLNRMQSSNYIEMDRDGTVTYTCDITYTYADDSDDNYTEEWIMKEGDETFYYAEKHELTGENPKVLTQYIKYAKEDEWVMDYSDAYYYSQSSSVANETIQQHVTPVCKVWSANGTLTIAVSEATPVQVYTMSGTCRYDATVHGQATIANLPAGIYIVKCPQETYKIKVK